MASELYMEQMSYDRPDDWADEANCKGKAYELFEYQEKDSPLAAGMNFQERMELNATNFELAAEVCIECPVFFQCRESASADEKRWTVRGGEVPTRFTYEKNQAVANQERTGKTRRCQRNHVVEGGGRCKACKREAMKKRRENEKAQRQRDAV